MSMYDAIKDAVKLAQQVDNVPLYQKILEVQSQLNDLAEELKEKSEEIEKLKKALTFKGKIVHKHHLYWEEGEKGQIIDGPFCPKCFDVDQQICRIVISDTRERRYVQCLKCKVPIDSIQAYNLLASEAFPNLEKK
jgi:hypothetical protein